jgi:regulator of protease activity HflC (stomatin/prohibitin superfamily)
MLDQVLVFLVRAVWVGFGLVLLLTFGIKLRGHGALAALRALLSARILIAFAGLVALTFFGTSLVFVPPERVGVVVSVFAPRGYREQPLPSGLHWIVPLAERVETYPIYWQTYTMSSSPMEGEQLGDDSITARTSDGQQVKIDCSVIFRIDPDQAVRVHIDWQDRYLNDLVRPQVRGIVRTEASQFKVDEINSSKRSDLESDLDKRVRAALTDKGFILDKFVLRNIGFSPEYAAAVEQKQVALQGSIQKEYEAEQMRQMAAGQADARIRQAKAEAQALELLGDALKQNPDLLTYTYIQKLAPGIQVMLVPNNAPYLLPLPAMTPVPSTLPASLPTPNRISATGTMTTTVPTPQATPAAPKK